jgi:hypothetical protein
MDQTDFLEFTTIMTELGELYSKKCSEFLLTKYYKFCSAMSLDDFKCAVDEHIATDSHFPRISDLLKHNNISIDDMTTIAWNKALSLIQYKWWDDHITLVPDGAIVTAINKMGGISGRLSNLNSYTLNSEHVIFNALYKESIKDNLHKQCGFIEGYRESNHYPIIKILFNKIWDEADIIHYQNELESFMPGKWQEKLGYSFDGQKLKKLEAPKPLMIDYTPNVDQIDEINDMVSKLSNKMRWN